MSLSATQDKMLLQVKVNFIKFLQEQVELSGDALLTCGAIGAGLREAYVELIGAEATTELFKQVAEMKAPIASLH